MAAAFNTTVSSLEDELTQLILDGQISARIDSNAKVFVTTTIQWSLILVTYSDPLVALWLQTVGASCSEVRLEAGGILEKPFPNASL